MDSTSGVAYKNDVVQDLSAGSPIQVPSGGRNAYTSSDTECLCCPDNLSQERQRPPTNATSCLAKSCQLIFSRTYELWRQVDRLGLVFRLVTWQHFIHLYSVDGAGHSELVLEIRHADLEPQRHKYPLDVEGV